MHVHVHVHVHAGGHVHAHVHACSRTAAAVGRGWAGITCSVQHAAIPLHHPPSTTHACTIAHKPTSSPQVIMDVLGVLITCTVAPLVFENAERIFA